MTGKGDKERWLTVALLAPTTIWFLVMLVMPLIVVAIFSFGERSAVGGYTASFTFDQYANLPARWTAFKRGLQRRVDGWIEFRRCLCLLLDGLP